MSRAMTPTPPPAEPDATEGAVAPAPECSLLARIRAERLPSGAILLGLLGSVLLTVGAVGAGGTLVQDPLITGGPLSWVRYGHGRDLSMTVLYVGFGFVVWAWVRLGRDVLRGTATGRNVLTAGAVWIVPMLVSPPLFTRDVYSYLGQGALALRGLDPYQVGPVELPPGPIPDNVHYVWQTTPAPYGPLFLFISKIMYWAAGDSTILGVIGMRLLLLSGLGLLVYALPRLAERLGGNTPVTLWLVVANPMTVVHLVGGPHNDLLMIGLLATGTLLTLQGRHGTGIALVTVAMAVKASAGVALPFLVLIWASRLPGNRWARLLKAGSPALAVFVGVFAAITLVSGVGLGWIPALDAPSETIYNWMSLPTGAGQLAHGLTGLFVDVEAGPFVEVTRLLGSGLLLALLARQWWRARDGGPDAVRQAAYILLAAAVLAPATLPWYLTWGLVLGACFAWTPRALALVVAASTWLVLSSYPTGESALGSWPYMLGTVAVSALAAVSLLRPDPLRVRARREPAGGQARRDSAATTGAGAR
ncbi:MAG: polyprenol phosphomannose-dependent alpha 1,6 mannosyltransferase MptB [Actinomycetota bacterium]|nr:polyprenol phosphomannose-dependent alpha 1,6 mannosyltransferase MptB [Actinomycetota bacterium]